MMFKSFTCAGAVLALLAGCGGGSSRTQPATASQAASPAPPIS